MNDKYFGTVDRLDRTSNSAENRNYAEMYILNKCINQIHL